MDARIYKRSHNWFVAFLDNGRKVDEIGPFNSRRVAEVESCYHEKELQDA